MNLRCEDCLFEPNRCTCSAPGLIVWSGELERSIGDAEVCNPWRVIANGRRLRFQEFREDDAFLDGRGRWRDEGECNEETGIEALDHAVRKLASTQPRWKALAAAELASKQLDDWLSEFGRDGGCLRGLEMDAPDCAKALKPLLETFHRTIVGISRVIAFSQFGDSKEVSSAVHDVAAFELGAMRRRGLDLTTGEPKDTIQFDV